MRLTSILRLFSLPRLRGFMNGLMYNHSSISSIIYSPLIFTGRYVKVKKGVIIYKNSRIQGISSYVGIPYTPLIILNEGVSIQQNCHITCAKRIEVGSNTSIAANVTITDIDHPYYNINIPIEKQPLEVKSVKIGSDCKIYNNVVILKGTNIGNHCVIGANSVVKGTFHDNSIIVGIPARIVKRYNDLSQRWEATNPDGSFILQ